MSMFRIVAVAAATVVLAGLGGPPLVDKMMADPPTAANTLAQLVVHVEDTGAHYNRDDWGDWDTHPNGCSTREMVLYVQGFGTRRDDRCQPSCPTAACWVSPYDGAVLADRAAVHIDHRVSLKEAMRSGARHWDQAARERYYNDLGNLVAVSAEINMAKSDRDAGQWQPPNRDTWCAFAASYVTTKRAHGLTVDQREHDALADMLGTCH